MQKKKYRVYELAKEFGKTDKEVIEILKAGHVDVTNRLSGVDDNGKSILARHVAAEKKKAAKRPVMRTVRFDQAGQPNGKKGNARQSSYSSYSTEEAAPAEAQKPAPKAEAPQKEAPKAEPAKAAERPSRPAREASRQEGRRDGRRDGQRRDGRSEGRNDRNGERRDGGSRSQGRDGQRNDRLGRNGDRPQGARNGQSGGNGRNDRFKNDRNGDRPKTDRPARPQRPAAAKAPVEETAQKPVTRRAEKPAKKKTKKDWERSRREKEGGSLMARSLSQSKKKKHTNEKKVAAYPTEVELPPSVTVKELAELFGREVSEIIKALMMDGVMATINQNLDRDTIEILAEEFGITLIEAEAPADPTEYIPAEDDPRFLKPRPAVVTIMGHVDHGKTTLLDALRQTNVALHEAGGITQRIGAYQIRYKNHKITFLDTPGHEAFTAMRSRGAQLTDIAVLIVAADDGVMPQTIEAIHHAKNAGVPIMVAINKIDKPGANPDRIKEELAKEGLLAEDWGGDVIMTPISAKKKIGLDDLLENILLVAEMQELKANPNRAGKGCVLEARLDKNRGPIATLLVQNGTLRQSDLIIAGTAVGRVRVMTNDKGAQVKEAGPSVPVEITGLAEVPAPGDEFSVVSDERMARQLVEQRKQKIKDDANKLNQKVTLESLFSKLQEGEMKELNLIVKADVQGSAEAVKASLEKLSNEEVRVRVIHAGVGAINESDILLASTSNAIVIGFNVRPNELAQAAAKRDKVDMRMYRVIYDAINEITDAMKGMLAPKFREAIIGHAEVRQTYKVSAIGTIAGCYVKDGKITRDASVRVLRDNIVIHEGKLGSLQRFKDAVKEVAAGYECGMSIEKFNDIKIGDVIECFVMEQINR